jgi:hypothetical protein
VFEEEIAPKKSEGPSPATLEAQIAAVGMLEGKLNKARDQKLVAEQASDLDALGNYLLYTASNMQNVATLSEPVRRDAIDIAKEILRKLRITFGDANVMNGLKLPPTDDMGAFTHVKGVAMIFERLLAWGRGVDASVMQHPSVLAGIQAIGQLGYAAKVEALRLARLSGRGTLATTIRDQLASVPSAYSAKEGKFTDLVDKVERGIDTLMSRVQTISGPGVKIGLSQSAPGGNAMSVPTAGLAQQASLATSSANAARTSSSLAAHSAQVRAQATGGIGAHHEETPAPKQQPGRSSRMVTQQRATSTTTKSAASTSSFNSATIHTNPNQPPRAANFYATHHEHEHEEEQHARELHQRQQIIDNQQRAAKAAAAKAAAIKATAKTQQQQQNAKLAALKLDPHLVSELHAATNMKGLTGPAVNPGEKGSFVSSVKQPVTPVNPADDPLKYPPPLPPAPKPGRGI